MKFSCTQENLHRGLSLVSHVASRASALPILSNILFDVSGASLTLSATNLEIGMRTTVRGKVEKEGKVAVPARLIDECVAFLPKENVTLTLEQDTLHIQSGSYENKIHTVPFDDFPLLPTIEKINYFTITPSFLSQALQVTLFAASFDDTRPELSGIYISIHGSTLIAAATDSYRLSEKQVVLLKASNDIEGIIIPLRTMQEVARVLSLLSTQDEEDAVNVVLATHQISFHVGETVLISRLIDGQYPQYKEIIPSTHESSAFVECGLLSQALKAASLFSKTGMYDISLALLPDENGIRVRASNIHTGENTTIVPAQVQGKEVEVTVNWKYISEGLQSMHADTVVLEVTDIANPMVMRPKGIEGHLYLVMPIRK